MSSIGQRYKPLGAVFPGAVFSPVEPAAVPLELSQYNTDHYERHMTKVTPL